MVLMRSPRWVSFGAATSLSLVLVVVLATATRNGDRSQVTITAGEANPADAPVSSSPDAPVSSSPDPPASSELHPSDTVLPPGSPPKNSGSQCLPGERLTSQSFTMSIARDSLDVAAVAVNTPEQAVEERLAGARQPLGGYADAPIVWKRLDPLSLRAPADNTIYLVGSLRGRTFVSAEVFISEELKRYFASYVMVCVESAPPDPNATMPLPRDQWKLPSDVLGTSNEEEK